MTDEQLSKISNICQIFGFIGIGEAISNEQLMMATLNQNEFYLEKIIKNQEEMIKILKNLENK